MLYNTSEEVKIQLHPNGNSYITGGNFGIGTNVPAVDLHVADDAQVDDDLAVGGDLAVTGTANLTGTNATHLGGSPADSYVKTNSTITLPFNSTASIISTNFTSYSRITIVGPRSDDVDFTSTYAMCEYGTQVVYLVEGPTNSAWSNWTTTNVTLTADTDGAMDNSSWTLEATNGLLLISDGTANSGGTSNRTDVTVNGTFSWGL
jgi:hypothetical protein